MVFTLVVLMANVVICCIVWFRIGRQKAYNELLVMYGQCLKEIGKHEQMLEYYKALHESDNEESKWTPVEKGLPNTDEEVIVVDNIGKIGFGHIVDKSVAQDYNGWNIPNVAFWMPYNASKEMIDYYSK